MAFLNWPIKTYIWKYGDRRCGVFTTRVSFRHTTMFTYSHASTPLGQSERAYYLSYFINDNTQGSWIRAAAWNECSCFENFPLSLLRPMWSNLSLIRNENLDLLSFNTFYYCYQLYWHENQANESFSKYWPKSLVCMQPWTKETLPAGSTVITAIRVEGLSL